MTDETIVPLCGRVLIRKDEDKKETRGGILLPDTSKTPVITGRVVAIAADVEANFDIPLSKYDKVLVDPSNSIPVEFENDNKLFIIPVANVVAVFKKGESEE
jgi:chaperonin GroES